MQSFEQEIKAYFVQNQIQYEDNSKSLTKFDFSFGDREKKTYFSFDVKEKRQHYNIKNWQEFEIPEPYLFIIDDLAAQKILAFAPNSGLWVYGITIVKDIVFFR